MLKNVLITIINIFQVVLNVGLCIALFEITKLEESYILPGDGASHTGGKKIII